MVTWHWNRKIGHYVLKRFYDGKYYSFKVNIYEGNCAGVLIYDFKEDNENKYTFLGFFNDLKHLKKCLDTDYSNSIIKGSLYPTKKQRRNDKDDYIESWHINLFSTNETFKKERLKIIEILTKAGHKVVAYYKEYKG